MLRTARFPHAFVALSLLTGCGAARAPERARAAPVAASATSQATTAPPPPAAPQADLLARFDALRTRVVEGFLRDDPAWARTLGLHEYDGQVGDYAREAIAARIERLRGDERDLAAIDPAALGDEDAALDLALLRQQTAEHLFSLVDRDFARTRPQFYEDLFSVNGYLDLDYAPLEERARRLVAHEKAALAQAPHVRANLAPRLSRPAAETSGKNLRGFATYLRGDVVKLLGGVGDAAFRADFARTNEALAREADALGRWLLGEVASRGDSSHVLGRERFEKLLRVQEGLEVDLDAFEREGEANLQANKLAYEALAATTKVERPRASELIPTAQTLVTSSRQFLVDHAIATLPTEDSAIVKETPPYARWNAASLEMSGPFDTARNAFYYITLPDPHWSKKEQEEYVFPFGTLVATTVHEVFPGHFLQGRWAERAPTRVQKIAGSYSFVEGWAHYVEQMMVDEGFLAGDAGVRLGQLRDALLRNCRYVVAIGVHTRGMTLPAAERRFVADCKQDKAEAREQAVRATFDPGYFAYTLGKMQILSLREEAKRRLGDRFSLRAFHDALLSHGAPPVALVRERVLADLARKLSPAP